MLPASLFWRSTLASRKATGMSSSVSPVYWCPTIEGAESNATHHPVLTSVESAEPPLTYHLLTETLLKHGHS